MGTRLGKVAGYSLQRVVAVFCCVGIPTQPDNPTYFCERAPWLPCRKNKSVGAAYCVLEGDWRVYGAYHRIDTRWWLQVPNRREVVVHNCQMHADLKRMIVKHQVSHAYHPRCLKQRGTALAALSSGVPPSLP